MDIPCLIADEVYSTLWSTGGVEEWAVPLTSYWDMEYRWEHEYESGFKFIVTQEGSRTRNCRL